MTYRRRNAEDSFNESQSLSSLVKFRYSQYKYSLIPNLSSSQMEALEKNGIIHFKVTAAAIKGNNHELVRNILALNQENVVHLDFLTGMTLLHVAAVNADEKMMAISLKSPYVLSWLNYPNVDGETPLIIAVKHKNTESVKSLLAAGADPTLQCNCSKRSSLHIAAENDDLTILKEIVKYCSDPVFLNAMDSNGETPLMIAVKSGLNCFVTLLEAGADHSMKNFRTGHNILHYSVIYERNETLQYLLDNYGDINFVKTIDKNGNTALLLAIHLCDFNTVKSLVFYKYAHELLEGSQGIMHYLISAGDLDVFQTVLNICDRKTLVHSTNEFGQTPIMYAAFMNQHKIVEEIIKNGVPLTCQRDVDGNTVLHLVAHSGDPEMLKIILNAKNVAQVLDMTDKEGRTPYEIILGTGCYKCFEELKKNKLVNDDSVNDKEETALFVAAKEGNYPIFLTLLLSEQCLSYLRGVDRQHLQMSDLKRAFWKGFISETDFFILTGEVWSEKKCSLSLAQEYLFMSNSTDKQNIFHACALGENINCLKFVCSYFKEYYMKGLEKLDKPDISGTTPLLLAVKCGYLETIKLLLKEGANLSYKNNEGLSPLDALRLYIPQYRDFLSDIINGCLLKHSREPHRIVKDHEKLQLDLHMFCPPEMNQMKIVGEIYKVLNQRNDVIVLKHPIIEYFVWSKWLKVQNAILIRFHLAFTLAILLSFYQSMKYCFMFRNHEFLISIVWWPTFCVAIVVVLLNLPFLFTSADFTYVFIFKFLSFTPLLSVIYLMFFNGVDRTSLEFGGLAVLFAWLSIACHGIVTNSLGQPVAMFTIVVGAIIDYSPIIIILLMAFSMCYFTLYHDYFLFNNPLHSFLYTSTALLEGDVMDMPVISNYSEPIEGGVDFRSVTPSNKNGSYPLAEGKELRGMLVEGGINILFLTLVAISLINMLVGLAVRGGAELEEGGDVAKQRMYIALLQEWESFRDTSIYKFLFKFNLLWALGIPRDLYKSFDVPIISFPLSDPLPGFDLHKLKIIAVDLDTSERDSTAKPLIYYYCMPTLRTRSKIKSVYTKPLLT